MYLRRLQSIEKQMNLELSCIRYNVNIKKNNITYHYNITEY